MEENRDLLVKVKSKAELPWSTMNDAQEPFIWPYIGVLANIVIKWENGGFVGRSDSQLTQELTHKGIKPLRVGAVWSNRGHSGFALVEFQNDSKGLKNAIMFDKSYQTGHCGNKDWNNPVVCPGDELYGWIAREEDYNFQGIVGQRLRECRDLKSISDIEEKQDGKTMLLFADPHFVFNNTIFKEMHSQLEEISFPINHLIKHKDHLVPRYNQEMSKTHQLAQKHIQRLFSGRGKTNVLLEAQKQQLETRRKELEERQVPNEDESRKIHNEKHMNEKATLEQEKVDHSLLSLAAEHTKEKEKHYGRIVEYQRNFDAKQVLELEIERMRGALGVLKHLGSNGDREILAKMEVMVIEKERELSHLEAVSQPLIVKQRIDKDKLDEACELLINCSRNVSIGVKKVGEPDTKPFLAAIKRKYVEEEAEERALDLCSETEYWDNYFKDPNWNPFIPLKGSNKVCISDMAFPIGNLRSVLFDLFDTKISKAVNKRQLQLFSMAMFHCSPL